MWLQCMALWYMIGYLAFIGFLVGIVKGTHHSETMANHNPVIVL